MRRKGGICLLVLGAALAAEAPEQPLPFSHKTHAGDMKLQCKMCHVNPDPGETEGIPQAARCMECHSAVKTESPAIRKLAAYAQNHRIIPWVRVSEIPAFVTFSHRKHVTAGNACEDCHGKVADTERLAPAGNLNMGGCMSCHQARNASIDCTFCHEAQ